MKGQYLAIEAVFTFGIGLTIALVLVTMFNSYNQDITASSIQKESQIVQSEVKNSIMHLKTVEQGEKTLELPEELGNRDYSLTIDEGVEVFVGSDTYSSKFNGMDRYSFEGTVEGGEVKLYKTGNQFIMRSG